MAPLTARLYDLTADVFLTSGQIELTDVTPHFRRARLSSAAFTRATWTPGDKLQLRPQRGSLAMRTYTPMNWNRDDGSTEFIAYRHGDGPATRWFDDVGTTAPTEFFGPSASLDVSDPAARTVFVGDETSIGLAYALSHVNPNAHYLYEASDPDELFEVCDILGIAHDVRIIEKSSDRAELIGMLTEAVGLLPSSNRSVDLVVTGDAATVNAVRRTVKRHPELNARVKARAYWAAGRTGLS